MKLIAGKIYRHQGQRVIFRFISESGFAICNPLGEPSMQDSMAVKPESLEADRLDIRRHSLYKSLACLGDRILNTTDDKELVTLLDNYQDIELELFE